MIKFTKKDLIFSVITGFLTGFVAWKILNHLETSKFNDISFSWLMLVVPVLWILGVNLGYFLGRWVVFFNQFGKFAAVGFTNAAVDFGILNLLIAYYGIVSGLGFSLFKATSFVVAVAHSYLWNKFWVFSSENLPTQSLSASVGDTFEDGGGGKEFVKFFTITLLSLVINVLTASVVVNYIDPIFGFNDNVWANISAVTGSALALAFSFIGFRVSVFKK